MKIVKNEYKYTQGNELTSDPQVVVGLSDTRGRSLLDSKLISPTFYIKGYNIKVVDCNEYIQVYFYQNKKRKKKKDDFDLNLKKIKISNIINSNNDIENIHSNELKVIEERNIIRSKLKCQRLAKANIDCWQTFITLTFEENVIDVKNANKEFRYFVDKVRRIKKDFKYLCITEFQKRGAIHYHLLTNVCINDSSLIYSQEDNPKFKHIKFWNKGFSSIEVLKGEPKKIIGYISKYMTKDIDNRLFGKHRYFSSQNLIKPKENFIDLDSSKEFEFYIKKIQDKELLYQNEYINTYDNEKVIFLEFKKN